MIEYLLTIIALSQITNILIDSPIALKVKQSLRIDHNEFLNVLFNCPVCLGFWVGVIFMVYIPSIALYTPLLVSFLSKIIYKYL
jgi:hypothetical protein